MRSPRKRFSPLACHRIARGLSQKEFARLLDVEPSTVCKWENGSSCPEPKRIRDIADQLKIEPLKVAELIGLSGN